MKLSEFDYELPPELIAQEPLERRDASRMLVVDRHVNKWDDSEFSQLAAYLRQGDVLVLNDTRVFPARLLGHRDPTGGAVEVFLVQKLDEFEWQALVRPAHRLREGDLIQFGEDLHAEITAVLDKGLRVLRFTCARPMNELLNQIGEVPLPPYIKRPEGSTSQDRERYQTVYARNSGAVAAPTAGLHFTKEVLGQLQLLGIELTWITLHVGYGTFEPVRVEEVSEHHVAAETFEIDQAAAVRLNEARKDGRRIVAVGTTTTRALESALNERAEIVAGPNSATLTIIPGFEFRVIDGLITNFHLPQSSLLLLVSAFAGRELIQTAYQHAVSSRYRFYSYGDCMLIL